MFFALSFNTWSKIGTEAKFGGSVASTIWSEQPAIERRQITRKVKDLKS